MPIVNGTVANNIKVYSPKFFDSKLTGSGKNSKGFLNLANSPQGVPNGLATRNSDSDIVRSSRKYGQTTVTKIPLNVLTKMAWQFMEDITRPDWHDMTKIATKPTGEELWLHFEPHAITIEETQVPNPNGAQGYTTQKDFRCSYQCKYFTVRDKNNPVFRKGPTNIQNSYSIEYSTNPMMDIPFKMAQKLTNAGWKVLFNDLDMFLRNYDIYNGVCQKSEEWQTTADALIEQFFQNIEQHFPHDARALELVTDEVKYIMSYKIPLDLYKNIYASVKKHFSAKDANMICKQNLNLLLSDTMGNLAQAKNLIPAFVPGNNNAPLPASIQRLSPEQMRGVTSTEPLILVQAGAGTGKAESILEPVLTPDGWVKMGDLQVGDKVIGSDGLPHNVLRIHERGKLPGYQLTFRDGSSVHCCGEHLWEVRNQSRTGEQKRVLTTEEWLNSGYKTHGYLPIVEPIQFSEKELPLDPYFLGALLADGALAQPSLQYTKSDENVVKEVSRAAKRNGFEMYEATYKGATARQWKFRHPDGNRHKNPLNQIIRELNLNVKSHDKFIPEIYMFGSVEQRTALINGLFDGDGDIRTGRNYARFNTASDQMADDVLHLLWSLGLNATKQCQKHSHGNYWSVNLLSDYDPFIASEHKGKAHGSVRPMRRSIKSATPMPPVEMRCIEVDAPDKLYVTKDYIVTHNSTLILGRIDYLVHSGIKPEDITVLSFTNAAADHITELNPDVHSMTIARMTHMIYSANFPNHELSSPETIVNSLDIYYPKQSGVNRGIIDEFQRKLNSIIKNETNNVTEMNNFVEEHYDEVIEILDTIQQTSLELEIIICYQKIDTFIEPATIASRYLIIDEVQDNSIFEFIYTLKYADKHKESLFMVGKLRLPTLNPTSCGKTTCQSM